MGGLEPAANFQQVDSVERTRLYHEQTKHHLHRYARSLGYMDWDNQPDPFRTYAGAPRIELPLLADRLAIRFSELYQPGQVEPQPVTLESLSILFELALGLSAWKEFQGNRWALRCNPSSGNLHPTEGYLILPAAAALAPGVYHYISRDHCLEQRCRWDQLDDARPRNWSVAGGFLIGLSSIHWREAWKYGERAFRYCQHDLGHALATVRYAAAALGWSARLLDGLSDDQIAALLGLDRDRDYATVEPPDREQPDCVLLVGPGGAAAARDAYREIDSLVETARSGNWLGKANPLSPSHVEWRVIEEVAAATRKEARAAPIESGQDGPMAAPLAPLGDGLAATLIRQRRSAVALDGATTISAGQFYAMLDRTLPRAGVPPWDALPWPPKVHLGIFVLRVQGLEPGLYLLERTPQVHQRLSSALRPGFSYLRPNGCPAHLQLFRLAEGDCLQAAQAVSCHQEIAADGAFSLGMLADFRSSLAAGAWWYRRLFWECGMLGQVLYLEAEAAGVRGTGIGCYFDDSFHQILGLEEDAFQDLYHFTVGGPVEDRRLVSLPPYAHLERGERQETEPWTR